MNDLTSSLLQAKLGELDSQVQDLDRQRRRIDDRMREILASIQALHRTADVLKIPIPRLRTPAHANGGARLGARRRRVLDAIRELVAPGEEVTVRSLVEQIGRMPELKLRNRTPQSTVSTTLTRAGEFERVRRGVYRRRNDPARADRRP